MFENFSLESLRFETHWRFGNELFRPIRGFRELKVGNYRFYLNRNGVIYVSRIWVSVTLEVREIKVSV
jgi:hypothetical protein